MIYILRDGQCHWTQNRQNLENRKSDNWKGVAVDSGISEDLLAFHVKVIFHNWTRIQEERKKNGEYVHSDSCVVLIMHLLVQIIQPRMKKIE